MQIKTIHKEFDRLQLRFGDKNLRAIYGCGCVSSPYACLVFMNPTARNISAHSHWKSLRAPWLGTKQVWRLFSLAGVISAKTNKFIQKLKSAEWTPAFAKALYSEVAENGFYITNLAKCTQADAHALPDSHFMAYREFLMKELELIKPKAVISFGNQVSSILCHQPVHVSQTQGKSFVIRSKKMTYKIWPTYYPVGQGFRNTSKALKNIRHVLSTVKT